MFQDLLSLLFPRTCEICNQPLSRAENLICIQCIDQFPLCDLTMLQEDLPRYFIDAVHYSHFFAYLKYYKKGITQKLLSGIKYKNRPELADRLGQLMADQLLELNNADQYDIILPVPLHPRKKRDRGYNQSDYFAGGLSKILKIPFYTDLLIRKSNNPTQTNKNREERLLNVKDIFRIRDAATIFDKHILLVDDVITTGATLESCAQEILRNGARAVSFATIAIALNQ